MAGVSNHDRWQSRPMTGAAAFPTPIGYLYPWPDRYHSSSQPTLPSNPNERVGRRPMRPKRHLTGVLGTASYSGLADLADLQDPRIRLHQGR
jgi:hypothetical protein